MMFISKRIYQYSHFIEHGDRISTNYHVCPTHNQKKVILLASSSKKKCTGI